MLSYKVKSASSAAMLLFVENAHLHGRKKSSNLPYRAYGSGTVFIRSIKRFSFCIDDAFTIISPSAQFESTFKIRDMKPIQGIDISRYDEKEQLGLLKLEVLNCILPYRNQVTPAPRSMM